jgi:predicted nucleic acid-binding protein
MSSVISGRVVNASPLIFLTHVGLLEVLNEPGVSVVVPDVVVGEIGAHGAQDPAVLAVQSTTWLKVVPAPNIPAEVAAWGLDAGEASVLAVALGQPDMQAVLDDLAARRCAAALGIPTQGTLGLILVAKRLGMIQEVRPVLDSLRQAGFYVSDRLVRAVLNQAGE